MEPQLCEVVTPEPFFKIKFGCGNLGFYDVQSELYQLANDIGIEISDGYITERCDYEGDLEEIIVYRGGREEKLAEAVLEFYKVKNGDAPKSMNIVLSIF